MAEVVLKNLTKRWGEAVAVDNQSLAVRDKEFLVLLGPSGCGKTTTMRMIAGLEEPSEGEIFIGGRLVNGELPKDRDVAMVFQNYGLYPHMSVFKNIAYPLRVRGEGKDEIRRRVLAAAAQVELSEFLERKPKALSGGQRQRVALARAIVRTPKVFLMDEPLSNLDAKLRVTMRAELKHLSRRLQITTVYVTHDQAEAMTLADRVAVMEGGVIRQLGAPEEIYNDPDNLFVAGFIGSPAMNLLPGAVRGGVFVSEDGAPLARLASPDREGVVLGVRADDIQVGEPGQEGAEGAGGAEGPEGPEGGSVPVGLEAPVYAFENTGENVLLTVRCGGGRLIARADRHLRKEQDELVRLRLDPRRLYLFDAGSGERIRLP